MSKPSKPEASATDQLLGLLILAIIVVPIWFFFFRESSDDRDARLEAEASKAEKDKEAGFHCLSSWDGSHRSVVDKIKEQLRDPDSFEHIETKITPVNSEGKHNLFMRYRANNAFGGKVVGNAVAVVNNSGCDASLLSAE